MEIKSKSLTLRTTDVNDPQLEELFQDIDTLSNMSENLLRPIELPTELAFRIEKENELIGEVRFKNIKWYNRKAELSMMIAQKYRGKGYGTEALNKIIEYGFSMMNLYRLEAEVIDFNDSSKKLVENSGFVYEGRLREAKYINGKYWDILRYGLLKHEFNNLQKNSTVEK